MMPSEAARLELPFLSFDRAHWRKTAAAGALALTAMTLPWGQALAQQTVAGVTPGALAVDEGGATTYQVPISVPPGVAGMKPNLSLAYSSRSGNGILGVGWSLDGLSVVHRCPRTVAQDGAVIGIAFDADDRFCLDGQRLVSVSGTYGANGTEYRTEIESFAKVVSLGSAGAGPQRFQVWTKTGQILEYGFTADARLTLDTQPDVQVWALNKVSDTLGNYMTLHYLNDTVADTHVIDRIEYAGNAGAGTVPQSRVQFVYENRPDPMSHYRYGSLINSTQRLASIETYTDGAKVKDYRLTYEQSPNTQRSRLTAITECAANGNCLAPTTLSWRTTDPRFKTSRDFRNSPYDVYDGSFLDSPNYGAFVDLNGDGRQDWIESYYEDSSRSRRGAWLSTETGWLRSPQHDPPFYLSTSSVPASGQLVDLNGDGLQDYIESHVHIHPDHTSARKAWLNTGSGWARSPAYDPSFFIYRSDFYFSGRSGEFVDFNGDGLLDYVESYIEPDGIYRTRTAWLNTGSGWARSPAYDPAFYIYKYRPVPYTGKSGEFVDVNGDGLQDYIESQIQWNGISTRIAWLNTGSGWQRSPAHDPVFSIYKTNVTPAQKLGEFVDVNGDGLMDWVNAHKYSETGVIQETWLSTGDGWELSPEHEPPFYIHKNDDVSAPQVMGAFIDLNGDGLTDWITSYYLPGSGNSFTTTKMAWLNLGHGWERRRDYDPRFSIRDIRNSPARELGAFADINGDGVHDWAHWFSPMMPAVRIVRLSQSNAPDLLTGITDSLGRVTSIDYAPLTDGTVYTKGTGAAFPEQDIQSPLYVVKAVSQDDGVGGQAVTSYSYSGARLHLQGRGFLGFAEIAATDEQTGIVTTTAYEQVFPYIGEVKSSTQALADGTTINSLDNSWASLSLNGGATRFPYVASSTSEDYEINDGVGNASVASATTVSVLDNFGNPTSVTTTVTGGGESFTETNVNSYSNNTTKWLLGRLSRAEITKSRPNAPPATRVSSFLYDGTTGLPTRETIEPDHAALSLVTDYTYDAFGNRTSVTISGADIVTRTTTTTYTTDGRFVETVSNALGHTESHLYDARFGSPTSLIGPNLLQTAWAYDGFGRRVLESRADGTETVWSYDLCNAQCPAGGVYAVTREDRVAATSAPYAPKQIDYFDALDRTFRSQTEGFDGTAVYSDSQFNARGEVTAVSRPYFAGTAPQDVPWITTTYDDVGRVTSVMQADGGVQSVLHGGLTTTLTNALLQTTVRVENPLGELRSVTDHLGASTTYAYDAFGNLLSTTVDGPGVWPVTTSMTYDVRGRKLTLDDPDQGNWSYGYNVLGELIDQTDAKNHTTILSYDVLGRMATRAEAEGLTTWTYDTASTGIGKLHTVSGPNGYQESYSYGAFFGRLIQTTTTIGSENFTVSRTYYPDTGLLRTITYPRGLVVGYTYNERGYLTSVRSPLAPFSGPVYWQAQSVNAEGQVTSELLGNGVTTTRAYNAATGLVDGIQSVNSGGTIRDLSFDFDLLGNLTARRDMRQDREELFAYDDLNRVLSSTVNDTLALEQVGQTTYAYDSLGNIAAKSDVGTYFYGENGAGPHAVTTAGGNSYTYDANGNMIAGAGRTVDWSSFNKPTLIRETISGNETAFVYGPDRARIEQRSLRGGLLTTVRYVGNLYEERTRLGEPDERVHYIRAGDTVAIVTRIWDGQTTTHDETHYLHRDHLGSVESITDEAGIVVEALSYDAHGQRRLADWQPGMPGTLNQRTPRGFTGHEHLDGVGLIHMNGRVYDPLLGRFLSADPLVAYPETTQGFNRYAYVENNPLSYTDPSGFRVYRLPTIRVCGNCGRERFNDRFWFSGFSLRFGWGFHGGFGRGLYGGRGAGIGIGIPGYGLDLQSGTGPSSSSFAGGFALSNPNAVFTFTAKQNRGFNHLTAGSQGRGSAFQIGLPSPGTAASGLSRAFSSLLSNITLADAVTTVAEFTPGLGLALEIGRGIDAAISGDYASLAQSAAIIGTSVFTGGNTGVAKLAILTAVSVTKHAGKAARGVDDAVDAYRAVSKAEADDIAKHGFRPNPSGRSMEDKWFSESRKGAEWFRDNVRDLDEVVHTRVPRSVYDRSYKHPNIDGTGPGFCVQCSDLPSLPKPR